MVAAGGRGGTVVLGLGARSGVPEADLDRALDLILQVAGLADDAVAALATLDRRAAEQAVRTVAARRGWPVLAFAAAELAACDVPHPSARTAALVGSPSVAEAAALLGAGPGARLIVPKTVYPRVTAALAARDHAARDHAAWDHVAQDHAARDGGAPDRAAPA
jgi:cobalamin biosynthesis protein CbiG